MTEEQAMWARIGSIVPLLSSSNDGEALNALRSIGRILSVNKRSFHDVAKRLLEDAPPWEEGPRKSEGNSDWAKKAQPPPRDNGPRRRPSAWAEDKADVLKAYPGRDELDNWSSDFMDSIHDQVIHQGRSLTEKQRDKLNEIMDKLNL
jgi:hypothetical protein